MDNVNIFTKIRRLGGIENTKTIDLPSYKHEPLKERIFFAAWGMFLAFLPLIFLLVLIELVIASLEGH